MAIGEVRLMLRRLVRHRIEPIRLNPEEDIPMNPVSKPFYQSTTTQNVAVGAISGQGIALSLIALLRKVAPGVVIWSEDQDQTVAQALGIVLTPLLSRLLAVLRKGTI